MRESDQRFYAAKTDYFDDEPNIQAHIETVRRNIAAIVPHAQSLTSSLGRPLRVLELGAGTCLASMTLLGVFPDCALTCADISLTRMEQLIEKSAAAGHGTVDAAKLVELDFSDALPFRDGEFDLVLFDAALHHSRNIWMTLGECRRILDKRGAIAALREQCLAPLTYRYALSRLTRSPEVKAGVAENAYLKEQYAYYFEANGFEPHFMPVTPSGWKWRIAAPLNGIAFAKWAIWAPVRNGTGPQQQ